MLKRAKVINAARDVVGLTIEGELKALPKQERERLLGEIGLPLEIPVSHCLAMKTSLNLSWTTLRTLRR